MSASGFHVPFDPSVQTRWWTTQPPSAHLANVAPHPNSTSSGCAPMASADAGTARLCVTPARRRGQQRGWPGSFAAMREHFLHEWMGEIGWRVDVERQERVAPTRTDETGGDGRAEVAAERTGAVRDWKRMSVGSDITLVPSP